MRSSMTTFIALAAVILGSTGLVAGPAALSAAAAGPVLAPVPSRLRWRRRSGTTTLGTAAAPGSPDALADSQ